MTKEQQRIAIAKYCGWKAIETKFSTFACDGKTMNTYGINPKNGYYRPIPLYLSNLNSMHEVEAFAYKNSPPGFSFAYNDQLKQVTSRSKDPMEYNWSWHATAEQRVEAFLKTLNLWIE